MHPLAEWSGSRVCHEALQTPGHLRKPQTFLGAPAPRVCPPLEFLGLWFSLHPGQVLLWVPPPTFPPPEANQCWLGGLPGPRSQPLRPCGFSRVLSRTQLPFSEVAWIEQCLVLSTGESPHRNRVCRELAERCHLDAVCTLGFLCTLFSVHPLPPGFGCGWEHALGSGRNVCKVRPSRNTL